MIELCLEKKIADYPVPQSTLDKVGLSCAIPTIGNPPGAIPHWAHWAIYLVAQTRIVTPSKKEAKTDRD